MKTELAHVWTQTVAVLERQLPKSQFDSSGLRTTKVLGFSDDTLVVGVPGELTKDRLEARYSSLCRQVLRDLTGRKVTLKFVVPNSALEADANGSTNHTADGLPAETMFKPLNPKYTFESFVIGGSNRFAHAASLAVAEAPAKAYNPLFIYGGVGLGKTHLMHAIGHRERQENPRARVAYMSTETFTNEFINSIRDDKSVEFQNRYRNVDVLLIDDIQFLAGKERTQEEFYHTFNAIHEANKQIVISSDRPPKEIPTLEDRLRSRFEWGLICDIQPPDLETRIAILLKKARQEGLIMPDQLLLYIATNIETNIRELEGALTRVVAFSKMVAQPVSIELAMHALRDILPPARPKQITIPRIQQAVSDYYNLSLDDFTARKRTRSVAHPRQIAMYLSRELTDSSLPKIGEEFGGRDHTTVIHACEKIAEDMRRDPSLATVIEELINRIKSA